VQRVGGVGRHPHPRTRTGREDLAGDRQIALAGEDVDDCGAGRGVLGQLLAGREGEQDQLDAGFVVERLTVDAAGGIGASATISTR
jgi:hypothetical protein